MTVVAAALANWILRQSLSPLAFGLGVALLLDLAAIGVVLYWSFATVRLRYRLDRNGLAITWGASRLLIPMESIRAILPGSQVGSKPGPISGLPGQVWVGLRPGRLRLADGMAAWLHTTSRLAHSLVVVTADCAYIVSPHDPAGFIQAWEARRGLGPT